MNLATPQSLPAIRARIWRCVLFRCRPHPPKLDNRRLVVGDCVQCGAEIAQHHSVARTYARAVSAAGPVN